MVKGVSICALPTDKFLTLLQFFMPTEAKRETKKRGKARLQKEGMKESIVFSTCVVRILARILYPEDPLYTSIGGKCLRRCVAQT